MRMRERRVKFAGGGCVMRGGVAGTEAALCFSIAGGNMLSPLNQFRRTYACACTVRGGHAFTERAVIVQMGSGVNSEIAPTAAKRARTGQADDVLAHDLPAGAPIMKKTISHDILQTELRGEVDTLQTRIFAKCDEGEHRSLWHDLPLFEMDSAGKPTGALNFVCEIPKWTRKKVRVLILSFLNAGRHRNTDMTLLVDFRQTVRNRHEGAAQPDQARRKKRRAEDLQKGRHLFQRKF